MKNSLDKKQNNFKIAYHGMELEIELFTKSFIFDKLKKLEEDGVISSVKTIQIPNEKRPFTELKNYYNSEQKEKRYFFAYIKFFEFNGEEYGLVGGKTNYIYRDISFDKDSDSIARNFLKNKQYEWSREIVIVNCKEEIFDNKKEADKQVRFLERFLQRQFNLFDS